MTRLVLFAFAFTLALTPSTASAQGNIERGKQVYAEQKCAACHSIGTTGNQKGPLDKVGAKLSSDDIHAWIVSAPEMTAKTKASRKPQMRSYPKLAKDDLDALVAYMASLK